MRNRHSLAVVTLSMIVLGFVVIVFLLQHRDPSGDQSSQLGGQLFQVLAIVQLCLIVFVTPVSMAGAVSGERQQHTWDLLRVTRLTAFDIVWSKLAAGILVNVLLLCVSLPFLGSVFLFGGVSSTAILHAYLVFVATILLLCATSLFVSVLGRRAVPSVIAAVVLSLLLSLGVSLIVILIEAGSGIGGLSIVTQLGSLPQMSPLPPMAQIDPMIALASALPADGGGTLLGSLGQVHHAFGLPVRLLLWQAYGLVSLAVALGLLALSALLIRLVPPWLSSRPA